MAETTINPSTIRPYHRPEPRLFGLAFWSLLIPAVIWVIGAIIYGAEAFKAQSLSWQGQGIGSTLMVIGGELGTITTAWQIFRKKKSDSENFWDWVCLGISLVATEGTLFVIFTRQTDITATWVTISQTYGPLALLLFSGLDVYANVHELGMYNRGFDDAWEKWNEGKHRDELKQLNKADEPDQEAIEFLWQKYTQALAKTEQRLRGEFANALSLSRRAPTESARAVLERDGWHCFYCNVNMMNWRSDKIHVDHFYPVSKGGGDDPLNLVVSCERCNSSKSAKEPTAEQVRIFKIHLVKHEKVSAKDKVLLLHRLGLLTKQKDIATTLGVSPSYVSSVMRDSESELSEAAQEIQEQLETVGKPTTVVTELPGGNGHKQQEKQLEVA